MHTVDLFKLEMRHDGINSIKQSNQAGKIQSKRELNSK